MGFLSPRFVETAAQFVHRTAKVVTRLLDTF